MSRESIVTGLLAALAAATGVTVATRSYKHFDEVSPGDMPYLILAQDMEVPDPTMQQAGAFVSLKKMQLTVLLYVMGDGTEASVTATPLNNMIDAIETALLPIGQSRTQTLGITGVQWVTVSGPIHYDGSAFGNTGVAVIPIEVCFS